MAHGRRLTLAAASLALLAASLAPAAAQAWGSLGHRLVCAIALMQLDDADGREVDRLAARFRTPEGRRYRYFTQGCTFADAARAKVRAGAPGWQEYAGHTRWHFVNAPRFSNTITEAHCRGDCVFHAVDHHFSRFANHDLPQTRRAAAMLLMSHWVADVHQPLHVSFEDDRGGNRIDVIPGGFYRERNLHAVWDTGILDRALGSRDWWAFARNLNASISPAERRAWRAGTPIEWARESFDIATSVELSYCKFGTSGSRCRLDTSPRDLGALYQRRVEELALNRIKMAGTRLAWLLARGLEP
jgi:hypothetical protein